MVDYTNDPLIERLKFLRDHTYGQFPQNWPYPHEIQKVCADAIEALEAAKKHMTHDSGLAAVLDNLAQLNEARLCAPYGPTREEIKAAELAYHHGFDRGNPEFMRVVEEQVSAACGKSETQSGGLNAAQLDICRISNITPEEYKKGVRELERQKSLGNYQQ